MKQTVETKDLVRDVVSMFGERESKDDRHNIWWNSKERETWYANMEKQKSKSKKEKK